MYTSSLFHGFKFDEEAVQAKDVTNNTIATSI
jgi:hypothetical protein